MMSPQCATCGAYYTGNETFCARCGSPRAANAYQQNPYGQPVQQQNPYGQPAQQQQSGFGAWAQNYYTPQRIVKRMIIGRLIGLAIFVIIFGGCLLFFFINVLAASR